MSVKEEQLNYYNKINQGVKENEAKRVGKQA